MLLSPPPPLSLNNYIYIYIYIYIIPPPLSIFLFNLSFSLIFIPPPPPFQDSLIQLLVISRTHDPWLPCRPQRADHCRLQNYIELGALSLSAPSLRDSGLGFDPRQQTATSQITASEYGYFFSSSTCLSIKYVPNMYLEIVLVISSVVIALYNPYIPTNCLSYITR